MTDLGGAKSLPHIFYYEFDGRRRKWVLVKIVGE